MAHIDVAPNGSYTHRMDCYVTSYNVAGGYAMVHYRYWVDRHTSAANGSWNFDNNRLFRAVVNGSNHDSYPDYDFRATASLTVVEGDQAIYLSGYAVIGFGLSFQGHSTSFPAASGSGSLGIAWTPGAPVPVGVDDILPTSARYRFSATTDNGSAFTGWEAQVATDAAFTQNLQAVTSNGTTTFTNLIPATTHYFRSRGQNAVGWGPWSSVVSAMTASGAYVSLNGVWVPVPVYVSNGTAWTVPELKISNGTTWKDAA